MWDYTILFNLGAVIITGFANIPGAMWAAVALLLACVNAMSPVHLDFDIDSKIEGISATIDDHFVRMKLDDFVHEKERSEATVNAFQLIEGNEEESSMGLHEELNDFLELDEGPSPDSQENLQITLGKKHKKRHHHKAKPRSSDVDSTSTQSTEHAFMNDVDQKAPSKVPANLQPPTKVVGVLDQPATLITSEETGQNSGGLDGATSMVLKTSTSNGESTTTPTQDATTPEAGDNISITLPEPKQEPGSNGGKSQITAISPEQGKESKDQSASVNIQPMSEPAPEKSQQISANKSPGDPDHVVDVDVPLSVAAKPPPVSIPAPVTILSTAAPATNPVVSNSVPQQQSTPAQPVIPNSSPQESLGWIEIPVQSKHKSIAVEHINEQTTVGPKQTNTQVVTVEPKESIPQNIPVAKPVDAVADSEPDLEAITPEFLEKRARQRMEKDKAESLQAMTEQTITHDIPSSAVTDTPSTPSMPAIANLELVVEVAELIGEVKSTLHPSLKDDDQAMKLNIELGKAQHWLGHNRNVPESRLVKLKQQLSGLRDKIQEIDEAVPAISATHTSTPIATPTQSVQNVAVESAPTNEPIEEPTVSKAAERVASHSQAHSNNLPMNFFMQPEAAGVDLVSVTVSSVLDQSISSALGVVELPTQTAATPSEVAQSTPTQGQFAQTSATAYTMPVESFHASTPQTFLPTQTYQGYQPYLAVQPQQPQYNYGYTSMYAPTQQQGSAPYTQYVPTVQYHDSQTTQPMSAPAPTVVLGPESASSQHIPVFGNGHLVKAGVQSNLQFDEGVSQSPGRAAAVPVVQEEDVVKEPAECMVECLSANAPELSVRCAVCSRARSMHCWTGCAVNEESSAVDTCGAHCFHTHHTARRL